MRHWRHCTKGRGRRPTILRKFSDGIFTVQAQLNEVEEAVDSLYGRLSSDAHFCIADALPMRVRRLDSDAATLALVSFLQHYDVPFVLEASRSVPVQPTSSSPPASSVSSAAAAASSSFSSSSSGR
eukprot:gb/GEZN01015962.1/.p1 GENE.gb/GEZN01015962.1/~~gb/GEZN01015962.1/.p1  ORF type:complete len:126 (+),score=27.36 gb/GEZN01015962.1/:316-693(+)